MLFRLNDHVVFYKCDYSGFTVPITDEPFLLGPLPGVRRRLHFLDGNCAKAWVEQRRTLPAVTRNRLRRAIAEKAGCDYAALDAPPTFDCAEHFGGKLSRRGFCAAYGRMRDLKPPAPPMRNHRMFVKKCSSVGDTEAVQQEPGEVFDLREVVSHLHHQVDHIMPCQLMGPSRVRLYPDWACDPGHVMATDKHVDVRVVPSV